MGFLPGLFTESFGKTLLIVDGAARIVAAAVASVFSMRLVDAGMAEAAQLTPVVFMVIVGTVLVYGLTAGPVARWLGVSNPDPQGVLIAGAHALGRNMGKVLQEAGFRVLLVDNNSQNIQQARMDGLPVYYGEHSGGGSGR